LPGTSPADDFLPMLRLAPGPPHEFTIYTPLGIFLSNSSSLRIFVINIWNVFADC
jgi:hypothetical protein